MTAALCSPGSHPHADQPNWKPAETADEYLANLRDGLEVYSERRLCKLLGTTRIDLWRSKMMAAIPDTLFDQLVNGRRTSARELAVIGSMFAGQAMHGVEVDRCPHCSGVLRVRSGVSADAKAVIDGWLVEQVKSS